MTTGGDSRDDGSIVLVNGTPTATRDIKKGEVFWVSSEVYAAIRRVPAMWAPADAVLVNAVDWASAGGPNECEHGYAAGIPCPSCAR